MEIQKTIHERMLAIMADLEPIKKSHQNTFQGYKYRSIDDFYAALNPLFVKHGVVLTPEVIECSESTNVTNKAGKEQLTFHVILKVKYRFMSSIGDPYVVVSIGEGVDTSDKATNKAMTAAFKNCMQQVFIIPTGDPADSEREHVEVARVQQKQPVATTATPVWSDDL